MKVQVVAEHFFIFISYLSFLELPGFVWSTKPGSSHFSPLLQG